MDKKENKTYNAEEIDEKINNFLTGWQYDGKWIRKKFKTNSWKGTLMVINTIGHLSECAWHHPDLAVSYAFVEVKLMTHDKKGITDFDFELAKKIDEVILWNPKNEDGVLTGTPEDQRFAYIKY